MASPLPLLLLISVSWISLLALLISPTQAATCTSQQTLKSNKLYTNCTDLPVLSSYLHWTYNASNSSLSVAFIATPSKPDGWVAWAINPTSTKMVGSQALVAYKTKDGTLTVETLNISSYHSLVRGKLSFDVWDISSEFSDGTFKIFATVKVPKDAESVNQVWQVGPGINNTSGFIEKHDFAGPNLQSFGTLNLVAKATTGATNSTGGGSGGAMRIGSGGNMMGLFSVLLLVLGALIAF